MRQHFTTKSSNGTFKLSFWSLQPVGQKARLVQVKEPTAAEKTAAQAKEWQNFHQHQACNATVMAGLSLGKNPPERLMEKIPKGSTRVYTQNTHTHTISMIKSAASIILPLKCCTLRLVACRAMAKITGTPLRLASPVSILMLNHCAGQVPWHPHNSLTAVFTANWTAARGDWE